MMLLLCYGGHVTHYKVLLSPSSFVRCQPWVHLIEVLLFISLAYSIAVLLGHTRYNTNIWQQFRI